MSGLSFTGFRGPGFINSVSVVPGVAPCTLESTRDSTGVTSYSFITGISYGTFTLRTCIPTSSVICLITRKSSLYRIPISGGCS